MKTRIWIDDDFHPQGLAKKANAMLASLEEEGAAIVSVTHSTCGASYDSEDSNYLAMQHSVAIVYRPAAETE